MNVFWLGLVVLIVSGPLLVALAAFRRRTPPDDTLALRLAAALDGTPPEVVDRPWGGLCHRVAFERNGVRHELLVGERGGTLRRLGGAASHAARLFATPLEGRAQEDYLGGRSLVHTTEGWAVAHGEPGLRDWETRIPHGFAASMRELEVSALLVERDAVQMYGHTLDVDWVEAALACFDALERSFLVS